MSRRKMEAATGNIVRLGSLEGTPGYSNHILYLAPRHKSPLQQTVIYFGGDIQDYPELMKERGESSRWSSWNLEATANLIGRAFPAAHTFVVRPARMEEGTYSCYDNFVDPGGERGIPRHQTTGRAIRHLSGLLDNAEEAVNAHPESTSRVWSWRGSGVILIGFSKGCVVLNQLVYDMAAPPQAAPSPVGEILPSTEESLLSLDDTEQMSLEVGQNLLPPSPSRQPEQVPLNQELPQIITDMYWLDGGHSGDSETWVTAQRPLTALANSGIMCHVHVTPFQMSKSVTRRDEALFTGTLTELGGRVSRRLHFQLDPPSLNNHFRLLRDFKTPLPTPPL